MGSQDNEARAAALAKSQQRMMTSAHVEVRAADAAKPDEVIVEGYAALFASGHGTEPAFDMGFAKETIKRGAFKKTLSENPDVRLLVDHSGTPLARTKSKTLTLREDEKGLWFEASLDAHDPDVQKLVPKMRRGDMDACSFAFRTIRDEWDAKYENRELIEVSLDGGDVSIVGLPAYKATYATVRSEADEEILEALQEIRAGKALSSKNEGLVKAAFQALSKLVNGIGLDLTDNTDTKPKDTTTEDKGPADKAPAKDSAKEPVSVKRSVAMYRRELEILEDL